MGPKPASMFAFSRPSCKTDARCLDALLLSVALECMTSKVKETRHGDKLFVYLSPTTLRAASKANVLECPTQ